MTLNTDPAPAAAGPAQADVAAAACCFLMRFMSALAERPVRVLRMEERIPRTVVATLRANPRSVVAMYLPRARQGWSAGGQNRRRELGTGVRRTSET